MNQHSFGEKPDGAFYYACEGKFEFIAWSPPPEPGDSLCRGLTGRSESQLVREILNGTYNHLFDRRKGAPYETISR